MKKEAVFTQTKKPHRGSYMSFQEHLFSIGKENINHNITPGKKYKLTEIQYLNLHTGEMNFKFINDNRQSDSVHSLSDLAKSVVFYDMDLVVQ